MPLVSIQFVCDTINDKFTEFQIVFVFITVFVDITSRVIIDVIAMKTAPVASVFGIYSNKT
jgi:hypothetical protein